MASCSWDIDVEQCCEQSGLDTSDPQDVALLDRIIAQVSSMMSHWSGFRYGGCSTVRPLDPCGTCRTGCCASGDCINLHDASAVTEVRMLGAVVDPSQYHFDAVQQTLCAVPPMRWPSRDPRFDAVGALEVDIAIGEEPDAWALAVAAEIACELIASCKGKECRLPRNATTVTRQGVTITLSQADFIYYIPSVSTWVAAVNPAGATRPARVMSPELRNERRSIRRTPW